MKTKTTGNHSDSTKYRVGHIAAIDNFRGLCILAMIVVHATAWFGLLGSKFGYYVHNTPHCGGPGFIMVIGVMVGFHYLPRLTSLEIVRKTEKRLLQRAAKILLYTYAFSIAFYLVFREPSGYKECVPEPHIRLQSILDLLIFQKVNHRTAILILISFLLLVSVLMVIFRRIARYWVVTVGLGLLVYAAFLLTYDRVGLSDTPIVRLPVFLGLKWEFPFLPWASFFFYGVGMGTLLYKFASSGRLVAYAFRLIILGLVVFAAWVVYAVIMYNEVGEYTFPRLLARPPSVYYSLHTLALCFLLIGLFMLLEYRKIRIPGEHLLSVFGKYSLFCFIYHWCVLHVVYLAMKKFAAPVGVRWAALVGLILFVYISAIVQAKFFERRKAAKRRV